MAIYRSKPTYIDTVQWTGENSQEVLKFAQGKIRPQSFDPSDFELELLAGVDGDQGWVHVPVGHWIVCEPEKTCGFWVVKPEFMESKYELDSPKPIIDINKNHWAQSAYELSVQNSIDNW